MTALASLPEENAVGAAMRRQLAGFVRILRDNGFAVGLSETRDALRILTSAAARKPPLLSAALRSLFSATQGDWQRFDEVFQAYWLGRGMRQRQMLSGSATERRKVLRQFTNAPSEGEPRLPDRAER